MSLFSDARPKLRLRRAKADENAERKRRAMLARPPSGRAAFMLLALCVLVMVAAAPYLRAQVLYGRDGQLSEDKGYKAAVDSLLQLDAVEAVRMKSSGNNTGRIVLRLKQTPEQLTTREAGAFASCEAYPDNVLLRIFVGGSGDCTEAVESYLRRSFLAGDMRSLVEERWLFDGGQPVALASNSHLLREIGKREGRWMGRVTYADTNELESLPGFRDMLLIDVRDRTIAARFDMTAERTLPGGAKVKRMGHALVARLPKGPGRFRLNGRSLRYGANEADGSPRFALVRPGDYVTLGDKTYQLLRSLDDISIVAPNGERVRARSLDNIARRLEDGEPGGLVESSIVASIHFRAQRELEDFLTEAPNGGRPLAERAPRTLRGAVTLMDGLTGEVAGAATFPVRSAHIIESERENPERLEWLRKNMNFELLPVGSTAKVPFATSIMSAYPDWLDEKLPNPRAFSICVGKDGLKLAGQKRDCARTEQFVKLVNSGGAARVGMADFITYSSNSYALLLLDKAKRREDLEWQDRLRRLGCVEPSSDYAAFDSRYLDCNRHLWRSKDRPERGIREPLKLYRMDDIPDRQYYGDFYLDTLGAGRGSWAMANLVASYARILGGHAVTARMTQAGSEKTDRIDLPVKIWREVAKGMSGSMLRGTSRRLGAQLGAKSGDKQAGYAVINRKDGPVYLFAKTGTIQLGSSRGGPEGKALIMAAGRTSTGAPPRSPEDFCSLRIMGINLQYADAKAGRDALGLAKALLDEKSVANWYFAPCPAGKKTERKAR